MMDQIAELSIGAVVALLILKEVFVFLKSRNGRSSSKLASAAETASVNAITDRLDRITSRLDEITDIAKTARKQAELNGEATERLQRTIASLDETLTRMEHTTRHIGHVVA